MNVTASFRNRIGHCRSGENLVILKAGTPSQWDELCAHLH